MIHDILLSCLSLSRKGICIKNFLASKAVDHFIHPGEHKIFLDIIGILNNLNEVVQFAKYFGGVNQIDNSDYPEAQEYSPGYYLKHFATGIETAIQDYYTEILRLESHYDKDKSNSLIYIYNALELQLPLILFLRKLIIDARQQKLHGCHLLHTLYQHYDEGDEHKDQIIIKVAKPVKLAFFTHLAHWMLFGVLDDAHSEFFISYKKDELKSAFDKTSSSTAQSLQTSIEDGTDIWQYGINLSQLPGFISTVLAEKVLFVGQTVLVFKIDRSKRKNNDSWKLKMHDAFSDEISELWNGNETMYYRMIEEANQQDNIDVYRLERVTSEIKTFVSRRLSEIAVLEDNLERQMRLIKDLYLLGRGEFYLLFLQQLYGASENLNATNPKHYSKAFEVAANSMGISGDLRNFTLTFEKTSNDLDESCEFNILQGLQLKYAYTWPLNLLFSPMTIELYNTIFRFLLTVRKLQFDMQLVWARHKLTGRKEKAVHVEIINFRNHLMFFLDNLQYYIQVDVLESQFAVLIKVIKTKDDFEEIQRAHSVFLANLLSQCFLLTDETDKKTDISKRTCHSHYSVYGSILDIFNICEKFSLMSLLPEAPKDALQQVEKLDERFNMSISGLIKLLASLKKASSFGPLSQLLLRLDYNHWFSTRRKVRFSSLVVEG